VHSAGMIPDGLRKRNMKITNNGETKIQGHRECAKS
jgi:hypothetical protein